MATPQAIITGNRDERRTLIVVFLRGGADGLSLVAPIEDDHYYRARPRIAIKKADAVPLDDRFGLHPNMRPLEAAWREGDLAIVHACGIEEIADGTRSHFEAQDSMEHGGVAAGGWLGRFLRTRPAPISGALACVAVGKSLPECLLGAPSVTVMTSLNDFALGGESGTLRNQLERLYAMETGQLGAAARDTFDAIRRIDAMRSEKYMPGNSATYANDEFSTGLMQLAQLIKGDMGLEAASIDLDGWDSHFTQETLVNPLSTRLAAGLSAFRQDLGERMKTVSIVVMTEFGRTVQENSAFGTDHGRGGTMWVLGGGVQGGRIHGDWRGLGQLEARGVSTSYEDLPVLNNYRNVLAPVLLRHGGHTADFEKVFPNFSLAPLPLYA
ncbi:MAG: DUF1501 domain-containing protein [Chthoniobacteraceae bacterium]